MPATHSVYRHKKSLFFFPTAITEISKQNDRSCKSFRPKQQKQPFTRKNINSVWQNLTKDSPVSNSWDDAFAPGGTAMHAGLFHISPAIMIFSQHEE